MAIALTTLVEDAERYLGAARISDYCPNGLQVEGRPQVQRIVSGVTASLAMIEAAVEAVRHLRDAHLPAYELEVVDLYQQPQLAEADRVVAAPTLVRVSPGPARRVAGDLTDARRILQGLGLGAAEGAVEAVEERADER